MESLRSTVFPLLLISWGVITVVLVVLLSYRATLLIEDDQNFQGYRRGGPSQQEMTTHRQEVATDGRDYRAFCDVGVLLLTASAFRSSEA